MGTNYLSSAENYSRFAFPASDVVFGGLLNSEQAEYWACISRMEEFLSNHAQNGWSEEDALVFHCRSRRYAILREERYGVTSCVITLHNLLHYKEDITNFGGLDNFSCWSQERAVRRYINQANNHKNIECSFAVSEVRREVLKGKYEFRSCQVPNANNNSDKVICSRDYLYSN